MFGRVCAGLSWLGSDWFCAASVSGQVGCGSKLPVLAARCVDSAVLSDVFNTQVEVLGSDSEFFFKRVISRNSDIRRLLADRGEMLKRGNNHRK